MIVALLGRPNVGKSSLFNRLIGSRKALVWDQENVTRDRLIGTLKGHPEVEVWDLPGFDRGNDFFRLPRDWKEKIDALLLVVDASVPRETKDDETIRLARAWNIPLVLIQNKSDKKSFEQNSLEYGKFGIKNVFSLSSETGEGVETLKAWLVETGKQKTSRHKAEDAKTVLILGRPNVGKSSLLNRLMGTHISQVKDEPGTTRDLVEARKKFGGKNWIFVDSAGVRKKGKIYSTDDAVEIFSTTKALDALNQCDFFLHVIEPHAQGFFHTQDKKILRLALEKGVPGIIVLNKWDLLREKYKPMRVRRLLERDASEAKLYPVVLMSAKTGYRMSDLYKELEVLDKKKRRMKTPELNKFLQKIQETRDPRISRKGLTRPGLRTATQYLKYHYMVQVSESPMLFTIFCNAPQAVPKDEKRFIENQMRQTFDLKGFPLQLIFRRKH